MRSSAWTWVFSSKLNTTWAPLAAIPWALSYGSVRIWWAIGNAPSFPPAGADLIAFTGWRAVEPAIITEHGHEVEKDATTGDPLVMAGPAAPSAAEPQGAQVLETLPAQDPSDPGPRESWVTGGAPPAL